MHWVSRGRGRQGVVELKTLGAAVAAVLALSAVVASAASAANFTASSYPTAASATSAKGNDDWKTEAGSMECHTQFHVSALSEPQESITVTPTYTGCSWFGYLSPAFNANGCDYRIYVNGTFDIKCPAGKTMIITFGTCEMTIGEQTGLKTVELSNGPGDISMKMNVGGISYTVTKDGFGCPFSGTGAKSGATYTQNSAVTISSTNGAAIDIG